MLKILKSPSQFDILKTMGTIALVATLSACTGSALPEALTARMDQSGASLNRTEALQLVNQFRASRNVSPLREDAGLSVIAQNLATQYASNSNRPSKPEANIVHMRLSAGYVNFAETFSGWRGSAADANAIADPSIQTAGLGVAYSANSSYGVHWVLLLSAPAPAPVPATQ